MDNYLVFGLLSLITLLLGGLIGYKIRGFKYKADRKDLEKELDTAHLTLEHERDKFNRMEIQQQKELKTLKRDYSVQLETLKKEREEFRREKEQIQNELTRRNTEYQNLQQQTEDRKKEVEHLREKFEKEFENLANKILEQKSEKFTKQNKENIETILSPLQKRIKDFGEKVEKSREASLKRHSELGKQLEQINEQNLKISQEANDLTRALKGESKTQGSWGEKILKRVLEKSGLEEGREFETQPSYKHKNGKTVFPDVVIHLPNDKQMVIDSKVSLTAYEKYANTADHRSKTKFLRQHISSLKHHINDLHKKKYDDLVKGKSPDFVLMFVPLEPALYKAQDEDASFFYTAFQKNILLVSPTTLLATLRTVDALWSNEKQQQNALKIARHAGALYHKFQSLLKNLETVGTRIQSTSKAYEGAMKKLTGQQNLIRDINKLEKLGISPKEKIEKKWLDQND